MVSTVDDLLRRLMPYHCLFDPQPELSDILRLFEQAGAGSFLEIGTHQGFTSAAVALAFEQARVTTVDLPDSLRTAWNPLPRAQVGAAHRAVGVESRVTQLFLDSAELWTLAARGERFDVVFIDGDHSPDAVFRDLMLSADLLRAPDSLLIAHDFTAPCEVNRPPWTLGVQQAVARFLAERPFVLTRHAGLLASLRRDPQAATRVRPS